MKEIELTQGRFALVDDGDYEWLNQWKWCYHHTGYAHRRNPNGTTISMHRVILNTPADMQTDHIDMNGLNNQRNNLRVATSSQNKMNTRSRRNTTSKFKGVHWVTRDKKWAAQIRFYGKKIFLGHFKNDIDGAMAYDKKAKELFGEFARVNFP